MLAFELQEVPRLLHRLLQRLQPERQTAFERLIEQHSDNALLHNDLAATYNKLGRYADAIEQTHKIIFEIGDKKQYAAAYYNAGFAYEQLDNMQKALANYKLSVANGNKRVQRDVTRVSNKIKNTRPGKKKSKHVAFNAGQGNLHNMQNGFIRKLNMHGNNTNNMA